MQVQISDQLQTKFENFSLSASTQVISIVSTKGGVGKTTLTANIAALLADFGFRVLMIDADVQPSLSKYYPLSHQASQGIVELMLGKSDDENIRHCISQTVYSNLDIVVSNNISGDIQTKMQGRPDRAVLLKSKLMHPVIRQYDFVLIDTQGAVGALQDAASFAADLLISPVMPETLSAREFLSGTYEMLERLSFGEAIGLRVPPLLALIYCQDRTRDSKDISAEIRRLFNQSVDGTKRLLNTIIPRAKAYKEATSLRIPVHCHDRLQTNRSDCAFDVMHHLAYEIWPAIADRGLIADCFSTTTRDADSTDSKTETAGNLNDEFPSTDSAKTLFEEPDLFVCIADILAGRFCEHNIPFGFVDYSSLTYPTCFFDAGHSHQQISDAIRLIVRVKFPNATDGEIQMLLDEMSDRSIPSPFEHFAVLCEEKGDCDE